ncbi:transmembrane protein 68 isoform X2 [Hyposmocoma kahamanoa]|uniref:transmembrane protein 68 isoform X2 n=1 Tax=Hyposmocoma kahamanoa TaxID=1477025 RepID=UPI000E6D888F|nr:transmembrane protein 68 isoform X2 [Hyposmocoma kahamanoa]
MIVEYVDTEYSLWLTWFLMPVIVTFLLPALIFILIYISAIIFHLYRLYRLRVVNGVQADWRQAARLAVCALWDAHGWLWHGYEIRGLENIPEGPFLIIYYHGALPIDMYYFIARMLLFKRKHIHTVADRFMFKIPGWATLLEGLCVIPGTVATCAGVLRAGNALAISPGGVYEAQFGDHTYSLNWKSRVGFARVAQEAKVPIIPMFTQNVREAFRTVGWLRGVWLRVYAATRIPLAPVYGGFPVKLITHLGPAIPYDPNLSPEQLQQKVASAIEDLRDKHQRLPGSILHALVERVYEMPKQKKAAPIANGKCHNGKIPDENKSDKKVNNIGNKVDKVNNKIDNSGNKVDNIGNKVDNIGNNVDDIGKKSDNITNKKEVPYDCGEIGNNRGVSDKIKVS